jgi:magnesium-transporting ATPase (P-type)
LCEKLCTSLEYGLTGDENDIKKREDAFDTNFREPPQRTPFCTLFFGALEDFMLRLLLVCAVISISFDLAFSPANERDTAWIEGTAIFLAVFIVASVGSWNDYKKEEQFFKLQAISEAENTATVIRNGQP